GARASTAAAARGRDPSRSANRQRELNALAAWPVRCRLSRRVGDVIATLLAVGHRPLRPAARGGGADVRGRPASPAASRLGLVCLWYLLTFLGGLTAGGLIAAWQGHALSVPERATARSAGIVFL